MELDTTFDPNPFHTPLKLNFQKNTIETQFPENRPSKITSTANTVTRPIACKITMDHQSHSQDEAILLFLQSSSLTQKYDTAYLTPGPMDVYSSHPQDSTVNFSLDTMILSLLFLGSDEVSALQMTQKITQEHMYILSLKELY